MSGSGPNHLEDELNNEIEQLGGRFVSRLAAEADMPYAKVAREAWNQITKGTTNTEAYITKIRSVQMDLDHASLCRDDILNERQNCWEELYGRLMVRFSKEEKKNPGMAKIIERGVHRQLSEDANSLSNQIEVLRSFTQDLDEQSMDPEIPTDAAGTPSDTYRRPCED